jgi:hypothetical protein
MRDVRADAEAAVSALLGADEDQLFAELGIRARALAEDPAAAGNFDPDVSYAEAQMGALDDVRAFGRRLFGRWQRELYELICGEDRESTADRAELGNALGLGEAAAAAFVATLLVGTLGMAPALATVFAAIVVKRFFASALDEFCAAWSRGVA